MITVITHELLAKGDVAAILESTGSEYIHVSSSPKKVAVVNLGMTPEQFGAFSSNNALNVFGKKFKASTLQKLGTDICVVSDGVLSSDEFDSLKSTLSEMPGAVTLVGVGLGKEVLMAATQGAMNWQNLNGIWSDPVAGAYAVDTYEQLSTLGIL